MKLEHLLKALDSHPSGWQMLGVVLAIALIILAPFVIDSFKGKKSA